MALRLFLLTLAVVDDLIAIAIIAIFYADHVNGVALLGGGGSAGVVLLPRSPVRRLVCRTLVGRVGNAPAAGCRGFGRWCALRESTPRSPEFSWDSRSPVRSGRQRRGTEGAGGRFEHRFRPLSAGLAVPVFAFAARRHSRRRGEPDDGIDRSGRCGRGAGPVAGQAGGNPRRNLKPSSGSPTANSTMTFNGAISRQCHCSRESVSPCRCWSSNSAFPQILTYLRMPRSRCWSPRPRRHSSPAALLARCSRSTTTHIDRGVGPPSAGEQTRSSVFRSEPE